MKTTDFAFDLPAELIAQTPLPERSASKLLHVDGDTASLSHRSFKDLPRLLTPDDLLVFNNTRVLPARLYAQKQTGGRVEILIERMLGDGGALAEMLSASARTHLGTMPLQALLELLANRHGDGIGNLTCQSRGLSAGQELLWRRLSMTAKGAARARCRRPPSAQDDPHRIIPTGSPPDPHRIPTGSPPDAHRIPTGPLSTYRVLVGSQ